VWFGVSGTLCSGCARTDFPGKKSGDSSSRSTASAIVTARRTPGVGKQDRAFVASDIQLCAEVDSVRRRNYLLQSGDRVKI